jgi:predicted nucleic acid-binding protein
VTVVVDSSAVVVALTDERAEGEWARAALQDEALVGPSHVHVEVSNVLRRLVLAGVFPRDLAPLVHDELLALRIRTYGFEPLAARVS